MRGVQTDHPQHAATRTKPLSQSPQTQAALELSRWPLSVRLTASGPLPDPAQRSASQPGQVFLSEMTGGGQLTGNCGERKPVLLQALSGHLVGPA